jgi:hypothetical protein
VHEPAAGASRIIADIVGPVRRHSTGRATEAHATFARKDLPAAKGDGPHPLYGPPDFSLILPQARTKSGVAQTIKDVTDHPWAGGGPAGHRSPVTRGGEAAYV